MLFNNYLGKLKCVATSVTLALSLSTPLLAETVQLNELVVFGDSLSDNGNLQGYAASLPQPIAVPATFTNGDVWPNYLAEDLNLELRNFAVAGAKIEGHENQNIQAVINAGLLPELDLDAQINRYLSEGSFDQKQSLKMILIGGNDLIDYLSGVDEFSSQREFIDTFVDRVLNNVFTLVKGGSKNVGIFLLPDISESPLFINTPLAPQKEIASLIIKRINRKLVNKLNIQSIRSPHKYNIFTFNGVRSLNRTIESGEFSETKRTWLELDASQQPTGNINGVPSEFVFWDNIHPMTRVHERIADELQAEIESQAHCLGKQICRSAFDLKTQ